MMKRFRALVALESHSPSQERAWLPKKGDVKSCLGVKPREPTLRGHSTVMRSFSHN